MDAEIHAHVAIIDEYRERLSKPAPRREWKWPPVCVGPTWQIGEDGRFILPRWSIGWDALGWCGTWLQHRASEPWRFTDEQARFLLWWMSLDVDGNFAYTDFVLQRLKGWGKDPFGACLLFLEMLGPCRFAGWDEQHEPIARDVPNAWVQTAAVSLDQTKNTMRLLPGLMSEAGIVRFGLQIGKEQAYALGGTRFLQAVTSSPRTLQGNQLTYLLMNETHEWDDRNGGHDMAAVITDNATKAADGAARTGRITNAYKPGGDSVAERDRDAYEKMQSGEAVDTGMLYDSLEAGIDAPLVAAAIPEVVESIRGDSKWLNTARITSRVLDIRNPPSRARRFWYNQVWAAEDSWVIPQKWDLCKDETRKIVAEDEIAVFFDGSTTDDATGLAGCRLTDGHVFTIGVWQRPKGVAEWSVPREQVDGAVLRAHEIYDVRAFFADPGAGEDETGVRYWDALIDSWAKNWGKQYDLWSVQSGPDRHPILWSMTSSERKRLFAQACERTVADIEATAKAVTEKREHRELTHDGHPVMRDHVRNARRFPTAGGVSITKEHRESSRKIDLAVCMVGARMLRRMWLGMDEKKRKRRKSGGANFD